MGCGLILFENLVYLPLQQSCFSLDFPCEAPDFLNVRARMIAILFRRCRASLIVPSFIFRLMEVVMARYP